MAGKDWGFRPGALGPPRGANPDFYKIGFYLIDSSEEVISAIRKMVDEFGQNRENLLRG